MLETEALSWVQYIILSVRQCLLILLFLLSMEVDFLPCSFYIEKVFFKISHNDCGLFPIVPLGAVNFEVMVDTFRITTASYCIDPLLIMKYY